MCVTSQETDVQILKINSSSRTFRDILSITFVHCRTHILLQKWTKAVQHTAGDLQNITASLKLATGSAFSVMWTMWVVQKSTFTAALLSLLRWHHVSNRHHCSPVQSRTNMLPVMAYLGGLKQRPWKHAVNWIIIKTVSLKIFRSAY